jgi:hypothetical protein
MIRFVEHKNIDKSKWDSCIKESPDSNIFVFSWYLDIVCPDWSALVLNDYEAVFPLATRSKFLINYIYQPFFTRYFGAYSKTVVSEKLVNEFFAAIPEKYRYIEFCIHNSDPISIKDFEVDEREYQVLELDQPYEKLYKKYSDNAKRSIKKSAKAELWVEDNISPQEIVNLFKTTKGIELDVFQSKDYKVLNDLMEACISRNQAESFGVYDQQNNLCAGAFFMRAGDRYIFLKSGVSETGKTIGAMHLLFDSFIRKYAEKNITLDFGGSSVESVARFYKNFGAKDCLYLQVKKNNLPLLVNWLKSLKK